MCFPAAAVIAIAGTLASMAGSAYNAKIQRDAAKAQSKAQNDAEIARMQARREEEKRQDKFNAESDRKIRDTAQAIAPDKRAENVELAAADPNNSVQAAARRYNAAPATGSASGEIISDAGRLREKAKRTSAMIDALAILSAQGTDQANARDDFRRMGSEIDTIMNKSRGSMRVNDYEASAPTARVTPSNSMLGDALVVGGNLAANYGGSQMKSTDLDFSLWDDLRRPFITPDGPMHSGGR